MLFSSVELVESLSSPFGETELAVVVLVFTGSLAFLIGFLGEPGLSEVVLVLDTLFFLDGFFVFFL